MPRIPKTTLGRRRPPVVMTKVTIELPVTKRGVNPYAYMMSKLGAAKGGRTRAKRLSPERRAEIARGAAEARWGPYRILPPAGEREWPWTEGEAP